MTSQYLDSERPGWVAALRAGAWLMVVGVPLIVAHIAILAWSTHGRLTLIDILTTIVTDEGVDRLYLIGLMCAGSGAVVAVGAALEGVFARLFPT